MADIPNIRMAKPMRISPTWLCSCFLENIRRMTPMTATTPVRVEVEKRETQPEPPSRADRQMIQPVTEVPMMAPMMTPMAWRTFIMPELTKPTHMTEVAEEDWMMEVTPVPRRIPLMALPDSLYRTISILLPATFFRPSPIRVMPKRKRATPLRSSMMLEIPVITTLLW